MASSITIPSSGGSPGGSDTNVQYNNNGAFGGEAAFSYVAGTNSLTAGPFFAGTTGGLNLVTIDGGQTSAFVLNDWAINGLVLGPTDSLYMLSLGGAASDIVAVNANGTLAAPTQSTDGAVIYEISAFGYDHSNDSQTVAQFKMGLLDDFVVTSTLAGQIKFSIADTSGVRATPVDVVMTAGSTLFNGAIVLGNGKALRTGTTDADTALLQAYDVDGTAYKTFATLTNGNTPSLSIVPPSGGTITLQATTFKSSDGTSGATAGPFTTVASIQVKNGLVTTLTGS